MSDVLSLIDYLVSVRSCDKSEVVDKSTFPKTYHWLLSDYDDINNEWIVKDPVAKENSKTEKIKFDGAMIGGGRLCDHPTFIADAQLSLVLAVEFSGMQGAKKVQSLSTMRKHVNDMKRLFNELLCLGFTDWANWDLSLNEQLLSNLVYKAPVSQGYFKRIRKYVDSVEVKNLPIINSGKNPAKVDTTAIYGLLGIHGKAASKNSEILSYWEGINAQLAVIYPDINFAVHEERLDVVDENTKVHQKQYEDYLRTLDLLYFQSATVGKLFSAPWSVKVVDSFDDRVAAGDFKSNTPGRTRNIPIPVFLKTMDAASRFVLDYADPLFEAEELLKEKYNQLSTEECRTDAGKLVNQYARELGKLAEGRSTPFPLAAYKHYQKKEGIIESEDWDSFRKLLEGGVRPKDIMQTLGLTKPQFDYRRKKTIADPYGRELPHTGISLQKALYQFLPLSCLLIIFAFSARRESEVFSMKAGCYDELSEGWKINFYVAKTFRGMDWFTTVPLVIKAIQTLERLSKQGRIKSGSDSIFRFNDTFDRAPTNFDRLERGMDSFLDFIGVEGDESGERFKFSEHQFRRFFAIMYFYRYEKGADFEALMHELRHEDWSMLALYLTEKMCGKALREVEQDLIADYAIRSVDGKGVSGAMAFELKDKLSKAVSVTPENRHELALRHLEADSLKIDFISEGLCFGNTPGRQVLGNCYSDGHVMCHRSSSKMCKGCPNLLAIDDIKNDKITDVMQTEACSDSPIIKAAMVG